MPRAFPLFVVLLAIVASASAREPRVAVEATTEPQVAAPAVEANATDESSARPLGNRIFAPNATNEPVLPRVAGRFPLLAPATPSRPSTRDAVVCSAWAKFPVGSWARYRSSSVSYENGRPIQNATETRVSLVEVDFSKGVYKLKRESTVKMGGVDYEGKSETVLYDFWDVPVDDETTVEELEPVALRIGVRTVPCRVARAKRTTPNFKETTTVWYSSLVAPYVLQRETVREPIESDSAPTFRELFVAQKLPARGSLAIVDAPGVAQMRSVAGNRASSTTVNYSVGVPGGVLKETTVESRVDDPNATVRIEKSLLDYYVP